MNIKPINNNGSIRIRFSLNGVRYNINSKGNYLNPIDVAKARVICSRIELDILSKTFDATLVSYALDYPHAVRPTQTIALPIPIIPVPEQRIKCENLLELWDLWVEGLDISDNLKLNHYKPCRSMISKVKPIPSLNCSEWLFKLSGKYAASTYNERLGLIRSCLNWGLGERLVPGNSYLRLKNKKKERTQIKPFTINEMKRIIEKFGEFYPAYKPYVTFLFLTGCRISEGIAIQWKRIDFVRGEITIADSITRLALGHKRKSTKSGSVTVLKMNEGLRLVLGELKRGSPEDLVFKSPKNKTIDTFQFRHAWIRVLKDLAIEYRKPYTTRHTLASHAIDQGLSLVEVAYILGHTDTSMVSKVYGHMINKPDLPDLKL